MISCEWPNHVNSKLGYIHLGKNDLGHCFYNPALQSIKILPYFGSEWYCTTVPEALEIVLSEFSMRQDVEARREAYRDVLDTLEYIGAISVKAEILNLNGE